METVWVLGDQLDAHAPALRDRQPGSFRVLLVESRAKLSGRRWHRQRAHLVVAAMRKFAAELRAAGHLVDSRSAASLRAGLAAHEAAYDPTRVVATEPRSWDACALMERNGVALVRDEHFLCHRSEFAAWATGRRALKMEDFYRWQRRRLGYLMDGDEPVGGRWNYDADNREPPPRDGRAWPTVEPFPLDDVDRATIADVESLADLEGASPSGWWPTTRRQALARLEQFVAEGLGPFGPYEDAMLEREWKLAHSTLASSLNLGLLHPAEVCDAAEAAYWDGRAPLNSVEGFIRQIIGWREYVWGLYWLWMPEYRSANGLDAHRALPPLFESGATEMACVSGVLADVEAYAWTHHIPRLMVLGNLALLAGVEPRLLNAWMWERFVDGAEWVMLPNVLGMALHADGGRMATKPYASGGAYINRMSDYCGGCRFDPRQRVGEQACPFTSLYWDFLARNAAQLRGNARMARQLAGMRRLGDLAATRERAAVVLDRLDAGEL